MVEPYNGLTLTSIKLAVITNFNSEKSETKTFIHEFGHFYGVEDHYGNGCLTTQEMIEQTGVNDYSEYCIYGERREDPSVLEDYTICNGCKSSILSNLGLYN